MDASLLPKGRRGMSSKRGEPSQDPTASKCQRGGLATSTEGQEGAHERTYQKDYATQVA
jgi:hypothetical protein